jgi:ABC-type transporter MlaC component
MNMRILSKLGLLTAGVVVTSATGVAVVAAAPNSHANAAATQTTSQLTDPGSQGATKLADAKLKACQNRETAIKNIMGRIADRGQKQLDLFTTIATRVETFYTDKGKTLSNYDALVADVTAKKDAAQTKVDAVKATSITFKCDGTDPKGTVSSFQTDLKAEITALKDYKTAVKNLIVGVKSVQGSTTSTENSQGGNQ